MSPELAREEALFHAALALPPAGRADYLRTACAGDSALLARLLALLAADASAESAQLLEGATAQVAAAALVGAAPLAAEDLTGTPLGPFTLTHRVGEGGVGVVYAAEQTHPLRREVAVKVIKPGMDSHEVLARFEAERHALALMDHPDIARVLDAGTTPAGRPYFVMELVRGEPITAWCDRQQLSLEARLSLFLRVCHAVQHAHQKGVIHRDLKPSNLLVNAAGEPKVIDFGIAKALTAPLTAHTAVTGLAQLVGTPAYMSPEQAALGLGHLDTRSDVYSLGVLLCELLAARPPRDARALLAGGLDAFRQQLNATDAPAPSALVAALPADALAAGAAARRLAPAAWSRRLRGELDWIVLRCLETDRERRYASAQDLAEDLRRHLAHEPVAAAAPSLAYTAKKLIRRHRPAAAALAAVALTLLAATAVSTWLAIRATRAEQLADERRADADRLRHVAEAQRAKAESAERTAQTEAATAAAISEFLRVDLLGQASPEAQRDRDVRLRAIVDRAATRLDGRFAAQPLVEASIREMLGDVYTALGDYPAMQTQLARAADLYRTAKGPDHADTLRVAIRQFHGLRLQSKLPEAEALGRDTLARLTRTLGPEATLTFQTQVNVAAVLITRGRFAEALPLLEQALPVARRLRGPEHANTLVILTNLALIQHELGDYAAAARLGEETLAIKRRALGADHPQTITSIVNLAAAYAQLARFDESVALAREALVIRQRVIGPDHPLTLSTTTVLAQSLHRAGRAAEARDLLVPTLAAQSAKLGADHGDTLSSALTLAETHFALGDFPAATDLATRTHATLLAKSGPDFPDTLDTQLLLGRLARQRADLPAARALWTAAHAASTRAFGPAHPRTKKLQALLAELPAP